LRNQGDASHSWLQPRAKATAGARIEDDRLISGRFDRRRRALFWSTIASAALHFIILTLLFYTAARLLVSRGEREVVSQTTIASIEKHARPRPALIRSVRHIHPKESAPARTPHHELAREVAVQAPPEPQRRPTVSSNIQRDTAGFAKEVARLNAQDDPHAIPTIDPAARESTTKSYDFAVPSSLRGEDHGNGIITPVRSWRDAGRDCYYGRYEFTYPDGAEENGDIAWPFCFEPEADPFKEPPHPIPFPLPLPGYKLPADAQLPPIEKSVYQQWAAANGPVSGSAP
jgi:hypothetical protein